MTEDRAPYTLPPKYSYSFDEEVFHGQFDSIEEALAECGNVAEECYPSLTKTVYVGRCRPAAELVTAQNISSWHIDHLLEGIEDSLHEEIGWDDQIMEVSEIAKNDLAKMIDTFLALNAKFNAYGVTDVTPHQITVED